MNGATAIRVDRDTAGLDCMAAPHLAPQEIRLLALLADGHSYGRCARELHVSINTVRNYVRSVYEKLNVHSKAEAVTKALRNRIIQ